MMSNYFSHLLEANMIIVILWGFYFLVLRHRASPQFNRFFLLLGLLFSLAVPFISISPAYSFFRGNEEVLLPISEYWNFLPELVIYGTKSSSPEITETAKGSWMYLTTIIYITGGLLSFIISLWKTGKLWKLIRRFNFQEQENSQYKITHTNGQYPTFSFLHFIFWDNAAPLSPTEKQQILNHEIAHVRQKHSLDLLLLECIKAVIWFNPIIYWYRLSLMQVHEHLADRYAVSRSEKESYLQLMVKQTLRQANIPLASLFFQHNTLNRIRMLHTTPKHPFLKAFLSTGLVVSLFFIVSCEDEPENTNFPPNESNQLAQNEQNSQISPTTGKSEIFEVADEQPVPEGGMEAFYKMVGENLKYPEEAVSNGIEGRVYVQFVVNTDGTVSDVKTVKGAGHGLDEAAEEVIKKSHWKPGQQKGKEVAVRMVMPISFRL